MAEPLLTIDPRAERDIEAAIAWYDARSPRLGAEFIERLDALLRQIVEQPFSYVQVEGDLRRGLMRQFPYALYYLCARTEIRVIALLDTSRRPDYWTGRDR